MKLYKQVFLRVKKARLRCRVSSLKLEKNLGAGALGDVHKVKESERKGNFH